MEIKDSGTRREFDSGAVRDVAEGKGRCDLLPLDIIGKHSNDLVLEAIGNYIANGDPKLLWDALDLFQYKGFPMELCSTHQRMANTLLEVSKHYEDGAKKYADRNWEKGIPLHCYIDSGVRHYLKWRRGDKDEPHERAFVWNMLGAIWTQAHLPKMIDLPFAQNSNNGGNCYHRYFRPDYRAYYCNKSQEVCPNIIDCKENE